MKPRYRRMLEGLAARRNSSASKDWSVYILRCADATLYTGIAKDVFVRLKKHNSGSGAAYTRARRPVRLLYQEDGKTRSQALIREAEIKALGRAGKESLLSIRTSGYS